MKLLNIGCGSHFHVEWTNIDLFSSSPNVQVWDIRKGLPYPSESFEACYHSHVLEHLTVPEAEFLTAECYRVLKPNGVIRVVVPNLEDIVRNYLKAMEEAEAGSKAAEFDYDWMMLEMYDQTVRRFSGGELARYLQSADIPNKEFVRSRAGMLAEAVWDQSTVYVQQSLLERITSKSFGWFFQRARVELSKILVGIIAGKTVKQAFEEGIFRSSGEIHRWMYDRFSLRRLLENTGFSEACVCLAYESRIPKFNRYGLDTVDGRIRKPDSLFMEAFKR